MTDDQAETVSFLKQRAAEDGGEVAEIGTHISLVLISATRATKLKRARRLPYLDFSTPDRRLAACEQEQALNSRTAPALYRGVHRITRAADGGLDYDGSGALVDAVVEMARFEQSDLFDRMAVEGRLTRPLMATLAETIARFHAGLPPQTEPDGAARLAAVLDGNVRSFAACADILPAAATAALDHAFRDRLARIAPLLNRRAASGRVRRCHGDLHLRNICLTGGAPTMFDCLEFDETLATTDILYDLAFLLMDLWHRDLRDFANLVLNRYLDQMPEEEDGLPAMPFLMALRAAVRAHVMAAQAQSSNDAGARRDAFLYLALARDLLQPRTARLVAVGGLSGTGKSTLAGGLAAALGPAPGARTLASDRIRKRAFGVPAETRLPADAYRPEVSDRVYAELAARAAAILRGGHAVIADAVFDREAERARIATAAAAAGVPFRGLWLEAETSRLVERVAARTHDASDATPEIVAAQTAHPIGDLSWRRLAAGGAAQAVLDDAVRALEQDAGAAS